MSTALQPVAQAEQEHDTEEVTANDRCDHPNCDAQAYFRCRFMHGLLHFCRHHYMPMSEKLEAEAMMIEDFTYLLD